MRHPYGSRRFSVRWSRCFHRRIAGVPDELKGGISMAYDWQKSSWSGNGGNCVEIAVAED
jgi:hypothetical protein